MNIARVDLVQPRSKTRRYDATARRAAAEQTRRRVIEAAHALFIDRGYAQTAVAEIAARAGVSVDTVYATAGRKPTLLLTVVDMVLAGSSEPATAEERDYVRAIRAAPGAAAKISAYADALGRMMPTLAPLLLALRDAGLTDHECLASWQHVSERRATNMLRFAADLRQTGELRDDLSDQQVADLVWSTNGPEWFSLLVARGYSPEEYAVCLTDLWSRTLLVAPS